MFNYQRVYIIYASLCMGTTTANICARDVRCECLGVLVEDIAYLTTQVCEKHGGPLGNRICTQWTLRAGEIIYFIYIYI